MSSQYENYDILIAGGGMVGASMAVSLLPLIEQFDLRVAIVDSISRQVDGNASAVPGSSFDSRSTALSYGTFTIFEDWLVWPYLQQGETPIHEIHVSDQGGFGVTRLKADELSVPALGYVVDNAWLGRALYQRLTNDGRIKIIAPAEIQNIRCLPSGNLVTISDEENGARELTSNLVVVADGGRSKLCQELGIQVAVKYYGQHAIVANIETDLPHNNVAYERFTKAGPLALLPLKIPGNEQQHRMSLVYTVEEGTVAEHLALSDASFMLRVQERFGLRLGRLKKVSERVSFPLTRSDAQELVRPGIAVIGNAATTLHPVAGQGFNLAIRGVEKLSDTIHNALRDGAFPGKLDHLLKYQQAVSSDRAKMMGFTDQVQGLFSNSDLLLKGVREFGLMSMELIPLVKNVFGRQAMGLGGRLPRIQ